MYLFYCLFLFKFTLIENLIYCSTCIKYIYGETDLKGNLVLLQSIMMNDYPLYFIFQNSFFENTSLLQNNHKDIFIDQDI